MKSVEPPIYVTLQTFLTNLLHFPSLRSEPPTANVTGKNALCLKQADLQPFAWLELPMDCTQCTVSGHRGSDPRRLNGPSNAFQPCADCSVSTVALAQLLHSPSRHAVRFCSLHRSCSCETSAPLGPRHYHDAAFAISSAGHPLCRFRSLALSLRRRSCPRPPEPRERRLTCRFHDTNVLARSFLHALFHAFHIQVAPFSSSLNNRASNHAHHSTTRFQGVFWFINFGRASTPVNTNLLLPQVETKRPQDILPPFLLPGCRLFTNLLAVTSSKCPEVSSGTAALDF